MAADQENVVGTFTDADPLTGDVKVTADGALEEIINVTVVVLMPDALFPVTVIEYVPGVADPVLEIVRVLVPTGVTGFAEKEDVVPTGKPETESVTGLLYPPIEPTLIV